jgi:hypothetical protein
MEGKGWKSGYSAAGGGDGLLSVGVGNGGSQIINGGKDVGVLRPGWLGGMFAGSGGLTTEGASEEGV